MKRNMKGFTLIEIMITVVIVGILFTVAISSYRDYIYRAQISEGLGAMSSLRVRMEQYYQDNQTYVGACTNGTAAFLPGKNKDGHLDYFDISCGNPTDQTYTLTATGKNGNPFKYTVDQSNNKITVSTGSSGWPTQVDGTDCWVISKNGQCQ